MSNEFQGFLAGTGCFEKKGEKITWHQPTGGPFWGAFGALKVLSTVDPATLCSSNRMEIIPQSDFNILTKIMPRNAKDMDVHHCAFWGNTYNNNNNNNNNNDDNNNNMKIGAQQVSHAPGTI